MGTDRDDDDHHHDTATTTTTTTLQVKTRDKRQDVSDDGDGDGDDESIDRAYKREGTVQVGRKQRQAFRAQNLPFASFRDEPRRDEARVTAIKLTTRTTN
jgi:hypothetical protein